MVEVIDQAKELMAASEFDRAFALLTDKLVNNQDNLDYLQLYGELLLETNRLEDGYNVFLKCCELDPSGKHGIEKFLYLGQIIGGHDGIEYLNIAINQLTNQLNQFTCPAEGTEHAIQFNHLVKKLNEALFAKIEIWMTDLCMEPEAESQCDEIINYSLSIDNNNPETFSLLSSIRISQQRAEEAQEAVKHSWELFKNKKQLLDDDQQEESQGDDNDENENEPVKNAELIELMQPLLTLTKFSIELELYDLALEILWAVQDINDQILEIYYYESLCHLFKLKYAFFQNNSTQLQSDPEFDYRDISNLEIIEDVAPEIYHDLKVSLTNGYKITQSQDDLDPEFTNSINQLLSDFKGPLMSELMPQKVTAVDDNDNDWEDEIDDD